MGAARQIVFALLYAGSLAAVLAGARRYLHKRCYTLEDWRHYRLFSYLRRLNFESLEKMRLLERIAIEKYEHNRHEGHVTYGLIFGGAGVLVLALALATVWI